MNNAGESPKPSNPGNGHPPRVRARRQLSLGRKLTFICISMSIGLLIAAGAVEIGLRFVDWPVPGLDTGGEVARWKVKQTGREGGTYPPGVWRLRHYDFDVEWAANSDGFHEREREPKKDGAYRIGLIGDSFTAGYGLEMNKRFSQVWFDQFGTSHPHAELWNLSTGLCGTAHQADIMAGVGKEYQFDEVILGFYPGNDLADNKAWMKAKETGSTEPAVDDTKGIVPMLRRNSRLLTFLWTNGLRSLKTYPPKGIFRESEFRELWPDTEKSLEMLRENASGLPLTIWYLPTESEYSDAYWQSQAAKFNYSEQDRHRVREAVAKWAEARNIAFVDLTPFLEGQSPAEIHFKNDAHWNERGSRLIGDGLAKTPRATALGRQELSSTSGN